MATLTKGFERRDGLLIAAAVVLYAGYLCIGQFSSESQSSWHEEKLAASRLAQQGMAAVKAEKRARGIAIDRLSDVNETGLIGIRYSGMTTTLGVLEAKRTSTHPDFAAVAADCVSTIDTVFKKCLGSNAIRDQETLTNCAWAIASLMEDRSEEELQEIVGSGILEQLLPFLDLKNNNHNDNKSGDAEKGGGGGGVGGGIYLPCLRAFGTLTAYPESTMEFLFENEVFKKFPPFLGRDDDDDDDDDVRRPSPR